jgi:DNA-binding NarL/FixJ family response regulator
VSALRILLADDHPVFRKGLKAVINGLGIPHEVLEDGDGRMAFEIASTQVVDLFLLDIKMPELDGYELSKLLLKKDPKTKIIVMTMYDDNALIVNLFRLGVRGFLVKNTDPEEIILAIQQVLAGDLFYNDTFKEVIQRERNRQTLPPFEFTPREMELVALLSNGKTSKEIAATLGLTLKTIETYRSRIIEKAGVRNIAELLNYFHKNGLL